MTAWGPGMGECDVRPSKACIEVFEGLLYLQEEDKARKRVKLMLAPPERSPSPPCLPHLERSPSPPLISPYPPPQAAHLSYSSFVMDKSVTHTFRSRLLDELEQATNGLIEGEASLNRALGRLWQVISEDPDEKNEKTSVIPKLEEEDDPELDDPKARRVARAPDLTHPSQKIFLTSHPNGAPPYDPDPAQARDAETLERSLCALRELQDDGREYVERLQEIREGLGDVKAQRNIIWDVVRERAIKELQDAAFAGAGVVQ